MGCGCTRMFEPSARQRNHLAQETEVLCALKPAQNNDSMEVMSDITFVWSLSSGHRSIYTFASPWR
jgi:hypothetical protein